MMRSLLLILPLAILPVLAGCVSTPADRIEENQALFDTYPPDIQALIRVGHIGLGFDRAQVDMALGPPHHVRGSAGLEDWFWVAEETRTVEVEKGAYQYRDEMRVYEEARRRGEKVSEPSPTETQHQRRLRTVRVVHFRDGRVEGFEEPFDASFEDWTVTSRG